MSSSTPLASTLGTLSGSSLESSSKPRALLQEEARLLEVLGLFQQQGLWSALETVLRAERDSLARAAVYSRSDAERSELGGVVKWIDTVLAGVLADRYSYQARERLGMRHPDEPGMPTDSNDFMESDGLSQEN